MCARVLASPCLSVRLNVFIDCMNVRNYVSACLSVHPSVCPCGPYVRDGDDDNNDDDDDDVNVDDVDDEGGGGGVDDNKHKLNNRTGN